MKQISTAPPTSQRQSKVARYLDRQIDALQEEKTVAQIADEAGFPQRNIMSMIRAGTTKLPFERLRGVAQALHVDVAHLFQMALEEYQPHVYELINEMSGERVSRNEKELLRLWRMVTADLDPSVEPVRGGLTQALHNLVAPPSPSGAAGKTAFRKKSY